MKPRFYMAMAAYGVLALLARFTLERIPRIMVWLFLVLFAVKTWIAAKQREQG